MTTRPTPLPGILVAALAFLFAAPGIAGASDHPRAARAASACRGATAVPTSGTLQRAARATVCLLNAQRASHGLRPIRGNRQLRRSARRYAHSMLAHRFFSHVAPGGETLQARIGRSGYLRGARGWAYGENLAWGAGSSATPRRIVRTWMASPGHRANILSARWRHVGVGVAAGAPVAGPRPAASYVTHFGWRR